MRRAALLLLLAALPACDLLASPGEEALAAGGWRSIATAARIARRCGVRDTRVRSLGQRRAVILMGHAHPPEAERCLRAWLAANATRFDPMLLRQAQAS